MSTVAENPWNRLHTCHECGHYMWSHSENGCSVIENKIDRSSGKIVFLGSGPCECKEDNT